MSQRTAPIALVQATLAFAALQELPVDAILERAGIPPQLLGEQRSRVTEEQLARAVQAGWEVTDDEMFGLGAHPLPRGTFRLICYACLSAPDLRDLLERCGVLSRAIAAVPVLHHQVEDDTVAVAIEVPAEVTATGQAFWPLLAATSLGVAHRLLAWSMHQQLPLERVELPFPEGGLRETVDLVFGASPVFDAPRAALVFDAALLDHPIVRTQAEIDEFIATSPAGLLARPSYAPSLAGQVRRLLEQGVGNASSSGDELARALAISPPTLRRRLAAEGTSMRRIRDDVLRDAAIQALVRGDRSTAEIGEALGFSEPSAFARAFRRWTGSPPSDYRPRAVP